MLAPMKTQYDKSGPTLVKAMKKRQFDAYYCSTAEEAVEKVLELMDTVDKYFPLVCILSPSHR